MFAESAGRHKPSLRPAVRVGLLGLSVGVAWLAFSLFTGGSSASAAEGQDGPPASILDGVGSTVSTVTGTVVEPVLEVAEPLADAVVTVVPAPVAEVAPVAEAVAEPLAEVAQPVTEAVVETVPAPVADIVPVEEAAPVVATVVQQIPEVPAAAVEYVSAVVDDVQLEAVTSQVTSPVTAFVDTVVTEVADVLPIVGEPLVAILGDEPTAELIGSVVGEADDLVGQVTRPITSITAAVPEALEGSTLPELVVPSLDGAPASEAGAGAQVVVTPDSGTLRVAAAHAPGDRFGFIDRSGADVSAEASGAETAAAASVPASADDSAPQPGTATSGTASAASGSGASGASTYSDAVSAASFHGAAASLVLSIVRDELPSSPVFDTDSTPD